jgi:hypothetical protein
MQPILDNLLSGLGSAAGWTTLHWRLAAMIAAVWLVIILIRDRRDPG